MLIDLKVHQKAKYIQQKNTTRIEKATAIGIASEVSSGSVRRKPNCAKIQEEDEVELDYAKHYLHQVPYKEVPDSQLIRETQDCSAFRIVRGYHESPLSAEEERFPLAFALRMHDRAQQAERVLRAIYMPQNIYCLYIDKKAESTVHAAMLGIANCFHNVFIASRLENFIYQSYSPVRADLQCMKDITATDVAWKYFINLAGSEYPLKTNLEMVRILKLLNGSNDIEQFPLPELFQYRVQYQFVTKGNTTVQSGRDKIPFVPPVELFKGCSYNLFSRAFVLWVLTDEFAQNFLKWSADTMSPDETVWATLNRQPNAPGGYSSEISQVAKNFLSREIVWPWSTAYCWGKNFVHSICILATRDLGRLTRRWEFFANKFDASYDHVVLDCLEEIMGNRTRDAHPEKTVPFDYIRRVIGGRAKNSAR
ncbi:hypothetical protein CAPTEDRAFT_103379 [Capitella teleta]|uniref:Uncharacterized protein n=1 Tax=Capitella teleta TaxID=283909 RepID=R7UWI5_CAPTE|nr:hypothetical protein CAPTEDRAFT_103379 [Capitella teleta]|eukprot:ELU07751.1 hypothetical protein CAPTEDRAFT_103379 [Capitella teleta]